MVVAEHIAELVVLVLLALRDLAGDLNVCRWRDGLTKAPTEAVIQDVAEEAVKVGGADAVVERRLGSVFARAAVVTGVGVAWAVGGILTLGSSE